MGVVLLMDDFGMGCILLFYMYWFCLYLIKFDGCLICEVLYNEVDWDIICCIVELGYVQQVYVIVEFVEMVEQQVLLFELGCDMFQGWYYSLVILVVDLVFYIEIWECQVLGV